MRIQFRTFLIILFSAFSLFFFFAYRLAEVPSGITVDEAASGYNGSLLADTLHDQNGRFLPIFVLSIHGTDWRTPYTQYLIALFFKVLGPSIYAMRLTNVFVSVLSSFLIFYLGKLIFGKRVALLTTLVFVITPIVLIQTHLAVDPIWMMPFILIWMIGMFRYKTNLNVKYLVLASLALGFGFYSYKGIRPPVVIWAAISILYIFYLNWSSRKKFAQSFKKALKPMVIFCGVLFPFFAIIPFLEAHYAGAVLNNQSIQINSIYDFFYYYLASFDVSFLFIKGDQLLIQSTGRHGMFLLATLPFFVLGLYLVFKGRKDYFIFLAGAFFLSPLLYGLIGSVFFAHRLLFLVPFYCIFFTLGCLELLKSRKLSIRFLALVAMCLVVINFLDFWHYYSFDYPKDTYHLFNHIESFSKTYQEFYNLAKERKLTPYISSSVARLNGMDIGEPELFARSIYFPRLPMVIDDQKDILPNGGILLSALGNIPKLERVKGTSGPYSIYVRP